jgi:uncharacterized protein YoaH (UPF0181 family)
MTHTVEPMTLEQVRDGIRAMGTFPHSVFSKWADAIDAELAKRREAEPVAYIHTLHMELGQKRDKVTFEQNHSFGKPYENYDPDYTVTTTPLYTHPQQRNAVEVTEQMVRTFQLAEMQFSESAANRGELIDPALAVEFALKQTLSAVASRNMPLIARHLNEWHEDDGPVVWWPWCGRDWAGEPAWCGTPHDSDWPGYHTHWTKHPDFPQRVDAIDAELAKRREAEPVAWIEVIEDGSNQYGKNAKAYALKGSMELPIGMHDLYTHPQQRNAVEVTPELFHDALIAWCEAGGLKTSIVFGSERLRAALQTALSTVASRDSEDAAIGKKWREDSSLETWFPFTAEELARLKDASSRDREDAERYRWLRDYAGDSYNGPYICRGDDRHWDTQDWTAGEDADKAIDAERRENKP